MLLFHSDNNVYIQEYYPYTLTMVIIFHDIPKEYGTIIFIYWHRILWGLLGFLRFLINEIYFLINHIELSLCDRKHSSFGDLEISKLKNKFCFYSGHILLKHQATSLLNMLRIGSAEIKESPAALPTQEVSVFLLLLKTLYTREDPSTST